MAALSVFGIVAARIARNPNRKVAGRVVTEKCYLFLMVVQSIIDHFAGCSGSLCSFSRWSTLAFGRLWSSSRNAALVQPKPTTFM